MQGHRACLRGLRLRRNSRRMDKGSARQRHHRELPFLRSDAVILLGRRSTFGPGKGMTLLGRWVFLSACPLCYVENGANAAFRARFGISAYEVSREVFVKSLYGSTGEEGARFLHESLMRDARHGKECGGRDVGALLGLRPSLFVREFLN